jgi:prephenate dehydratase
VVPVRHHLAVVPGGTVQEIASVESHPQALGQCRRFLERCLPGVNQVAALSTAAAVADVVRQQNRSRAAIGTIRAAELYGAEIIAHDIQDNDSNVTRFFVLGYEDAPPTGADRTSICFTVKRNVPGAIHDVLTDLAVAGIQMTKIESRPTKEALGQYFFLIDVEGHRLDPIIASALAAIEAKTEQFKVFGSYPRFEPSAHEAVR